MNYALQAGLTLALLYTVYWLFLSRTGLHRLNRFVLLGIAITSLVLPLVARYLPNLTPTPNIIADGKVSYTPPFNPITGPLFAPPSSIAPIAGNPVSPLHFNLIPLTLAVLYGLGVTISLIRLLTSVLGLTKLIRKTPKHHSPHYTLVQLEQPSPPFSFFRYIFLHLESYSESQQQNILLHEQVHIQQQHTLDILFMEVFSALFWFHPLAWRLNKQTRLNLEYLADQQILKKGVEPKEYQYQLLQMTVGPSLTRLANYFNQSHLQKRIAMINSTPRRTNSWKYATFAPALTALCLVFTTGNAQTVPQPGSSDIYVVVRPGTSERLLKQIQTELTTDGIDLAFTDPVYTDKHELSGVHVTLARNGQTLESLTLTNTDKPLAEPIVFYWLRSRDGNPILTRGYPSDVDKKRLKIMRNLNGLLRNNPASKEIDLHGSARIED
jgi:hypothetical protein